MRTVMALMFMVGAANATPVTDGWWSSPEFGKTIDLNFPDFLIFEFEPEEKTVRCQITSWPISTPVAQAECDDGSTPTIEIHADRVVFDGFPLVQSFEDPF